MKKLSILTIVLIFLVSNVSALYILNESYESQEFREINITQECDESEQLIESDNSFFCVVCEGNLIIQGQENFLCEKCPEGFVYQDSKCNPTTQMSEVTTKAKEIYKMYIKGFSEGENEFIVYMLFGVFSLIFFNSILSNKYGPRRR